ncbi:hypothetical protein V1477_016178 [Vespula maculifrons]|uniref:Uncharacterized protein n=2 Tax=Vespula TaxID=7451 RepID=A0A834K5M8_VESVU|nr:hypothetical protein HZH66_006701 [Vespula vulgaris]
MNGIKRRGRLGCNEKESKSGGTMRYEKIIAEHPVFKPLCVAVPEISCENAINTKVNAWSKKKVLQASQNG